MPYIFLVSSDSKKSLELLLYTILILFPFFALIFYFKLKHLEIKNENIIHKDFFLSLKNFFKNFPHHKKLFFAFLLNNLANALPATLFLFFVKYVLNLEDKIFDKLRVLSTSKMFAETIKRVVVSEAISDLFEMPIEDSEY